MWKSIGCMVLLFTVGWASPGVALEWKTTPLVPLQGESLEVSDLKGKVVVVVNVASRCGFTSQYKGLQALYERYKDRGLVVVGVPCNQFMGQEPGTAKEIATFCSTRYGVTFPLLAKQNVNGAKRSGLYQALVSSEVGGGKRVGWNFEKFVVGRDGAVLARYGSSTTPEDLGLIQTIEQALQ